MNYDKINKTVIQPMTDTDIRNYLPDAKIIKYEELSEFDSIKELLPQEKDYVIILFETSKNIGQFICVIRNNKQIIFFDPYGNRPDKFLFWCTKYTRKKLNQDVPHLSLLLNQAIDEKFKVYFNQIKFQNEDQISYATCGRWCVAVIKYFMTNQKPTIKGFYKIIFKKANLFELNFDLTISALIP